MDGAEKVDKPSGEWGASEEAKGFFEEIAGGMTPAEKIGWLHWVRENLARWVR